MNPKVLKPGNLNPLTYAARQVIPQTCIEEGTLALGERNLTPTLA